MLIALTTAAAAPAVSLTTETSRMTEPARAVTATSVTPALTLCICASRAVRMACRSRDSTEPATVSCVRVTTFSLAPGGLGCGEGGGGGGGKGGKGGGGGGEEMTPVRSLRTKKFMLALAVRVVEPKATVFENLPVTIVLPDASDVMPVP